MKTIRKGVNALLLLGLLVLVPALLQSTARADSLNDLDNMSLTEELENSFDQLGFWEIQMSTLGELDPNSSDPVGYDIDLKALFRTDNSQRDRVEYGTIERWKIFRGALPEGLSFTITGSYTLRLQGTPRTAGTCEIWLGTTGRNMWGSKEYMTRLERLVLIVGEDQELYKLWVDGKTVASSNKADILNDGTFSYNAATKTLTIHNDYSTESDNVIRSRIDGLTIQADNGAILNSKEAALLLEGDTTIHSGGLLYAKSGIVCAADCLLTLQAANVSALSQRGTAILGGGGGARLIISDASVSADGLQAAIKGFGGGIEVEGEAVLATPEGGSYASGEVRTRPTASAPAGAVATRAAIRSITYMLTVNGQRIQPGVNVDGAFVFDVGAKTLTIEKSYQTAAGYLFYSDVSGLTIRVDKDVTLTGNSCLYLNGDTTLTGEGTLTLNAEKDAIHVEAGTLTVKTLNVDANGGRYGVRGGGSGTRLSIDNAKLYATGNTAAVSNFGAIAPEYGVSLQMPEGGSYQSGTVKNSNGGNATEAYFYSVLKYGVTVGGSDVTEQNKNDILNNGLFSFDPETNTLSVKGSYTSLLGPVIYNERKGLIVKTERDATLALGAAVEGATVLTTEDMTVTGPGKLTVNAHDCGIQASGDALTLSYLDLSISGARYAISGNSVMPNKLILHSADVHADTSMAANSLSAICNFTGGIELHGCELRNGRVFNGKIVAVNGDDVTRVEIFSRPELYFLNVKYGKLDIAVLELPDTGRSVTWIVASYDESGRLLETTTGTVLSRAGATVERTVNVRGDAAYYRLFLVDDAFRPLARCAAFP